MRKCMLSLVVVILLLLGAVGACADGEISLFYVRAQSVVATLTVSGNSATCKGTVASTNSSDQISMTMTLKKKSGSSWTKIDSWTGSDKGTLILSKKKTLTTGTYKVFVTAKIKDSNGNLLEAVNKESTEKVVK